MNNQPFPGLNYVRVGKAKLHYQMDDWLLWENMPELGEYAFERLVEAVAALAARLRKQMQTLEVSWDIDTSELLERVL